MSAPQPEIRRVAGVVLLRDDHAALLQLRDEKPGLRLAGNWVFPGGHCDAGESYEGCAHREFLEETGYDCAQLWQLTEFIDDTELPHQRLTFFAAKYDGRQPTRCMEGQALEFVTRAAAPQLKAPPYLMPVWDLAVAATNPPKQN